MHNITLKKWTKWQVIILKKRTFCIITGLYMMRSRHSDFTPVSKNSSPRKKTPYICGLRARIECEREGEHSTHSDRVTNIGYLLSLEASALPNCGKSPIHLPNLSLVYWSKLKIKALNCCKVIFRCFRTTNLRTL